MSNLTLEVRKILNEYNPEKEMSKKLLDAIELVAEEVEDLSDKVNDLMKSMVKEKFYQ